MIHMIHMIHLYHMIHAGLCESGARRARARAM